MRLRDLGSWHIVLRHLMPVPRLEHLGYVMSNSIPAAMQNINGRNAGIRMLCMHDYSGKIYITRGKDVKFRTKPKECSICHQCLKSLGTGWFQVKESWKRVFFLATLVCLNSFTSPIRRTDLHGVRRHVDMCSARVPFLTGASAGEALLVASKFDELPHLILEKCKGWRQLI